MFCVVLTPCIAVIAELCVALIFCIDTRAASCNTSFDFKPDMSLSCCESFVCKSPMADVFVPICVFNDSVNADY